MADASRISQLTNRTDSDRRADAELARQTIDATAGAGMVQVRIDGYGTLKSLIIAPEAFENRDADLLADLIMSAVSEAQRRLVDNG